MMSMVLLNKRAVSAFLLFSEGANAGRHQGSAWGKLVALIHDALRRSLDRIERNLCFKASNATQVGARLMRSLYRTRKR